jgi:hypothetical protein
VADADGVGAAFAAFAALWAIAAICHVLGPSGRLGEVMIAPSALSVSQLALAALALWLVATPHATAPLVCVAIAGLLCAWQESPSIGSHWVLAAFVNVAILMSVVAGSRAVSSPRVATMTALVPTATWTLLVFYGFAAFSKLNTAFVDPRVGCANYFVDETARSMGIAGVGHLATTAVVPWCVIAIETAIPLGLLFSRTRRLAVIVALIFHWAISLDRLHPFGDFSAVLTALFCLFLPVGTLRPIVSAIDRRSEAWLYHATVWAALIAFRVTATGPVLQRQQLSIDLSAWQIFGVAVIGAVWWSTARFTEPGGALALRRAPSWAVVLIALVFLNGAAPYVELKSGASFNMYSNLAIAGGQTNHLIVRTSFPIGHRLIDPVRIVQSSDPGLALYARSNYDLPWDSFRAYVARHHGAAVRYQRAGRDYDLEPSDDVLNINAPLLVVEKLLPLRAIDQLVPARCQASYLPAL